MSLEMCRNGRYEALLMLMSPQLRASLDCCFCSSWTYNYNVHVGRGTCHILRFFSLTDDQKFVRITAHSNVVVNRSGKKDRMSIPKKGIRENVGACVVHSCIKRESCYVSGMLSSLSSNPRIPQSLSHKSLSHLKFYQAFLTLFSSGADLWLQLK